jgi:ribosomal protein L11 methylase PrmA
MPTSVLFFLLVLILAAAGYVGVKAFLSGLLPTMVWGAPYVPTNAALARIVIELARITSTDRVIDLGSGDGRLVIAAAEAGAKEAIGYEIDPVKVRASKKEAERLHLSNAIFYAQSFWNVPLNAVDVVFIYSLPPYIKRLEKKLRQELKPGARVVMLMDELPGWKLQAKQQGVRLYQRD